VSAVKCVLVQNGKFVIVPEEMAARKQFSAPLVFAFDSILPSATRGAKLRGGEWTGPLPSDSKCVSIKVGLILLKQDPTPCGVSSS
jgi:hypothetical protein